MQAVVIALLSGVSSALVTQVLIVGVEKWRGSVSAGHLALKVASTLERFAADCMTGIQDNRNGYEEGLGHDRLSTSLPKLGELYPADDGWRFIDRELAAKVLAFPDAISFAGGAVSDEFRYGSPATAWVTCNDQCAKVGQQAVTLAQRLRDAHAQHDAKPEWDYRGLLTIENKRIAGEEAAFQERVRNDAKLFAAN